MKVTTWNLNGIRSLKGVGVQKALADFDADVICVQETKVVQEQLTSDIALIPGYNSYFAYCSGARKGDILEQ